ncbi:MAG: DUF4380 domain-containing protein [Fimbriimonas sp.]
MLGVLALTLGLASPGNVKVETVAFEGWQNCLRLSDGVVDAIVVPQIGRIMRFGYVGKPNLIWVNPNLKGTLPTSSPDWPNFGGDKLWNAPQAVWGWPPDASFESSPHDVVVHGNQISLKSPVSKKYGIRFEREITLQGSKLRIKNTLVNAGTAPVEWAIWQVTQINIPDRVELELSGKKDPNGKLWSFYDPADFPGWVTETTRNGKPLLIAKRHPTQAYKLGTDFGNGTIQAWFGTARLTVHIDADQGGMYPDKNRPRQVYSNPGENLYMELELNGMIKKIAAGAKIEVSTTLSLD